MRHFYSHIVKIEEVTVELDELDLTDSQRKHLAEILDSTVHHIVLDTVLTKLGEEDRMTFLAKLRKDPEDQTLMTYLVERVENIEGEIDIAIVSLKEELIADIKEAKKRT